MVGRLVFLRVNVSLVYILVGPEVRSSCLAEFTGSSGKRSKAERVEHKHSNPGDDTRKVVQIAQNGEAKRREQALGK
ncbi:unnamed protein product [Angiostrongylus costaricensis]|uniref:Secreted protein n=1 Tax=Angiostrongylus costaricensis TaxID=334426 RepID=A0A0R3PU98_ANGCS|nr:unnamed protein product [Angiostrongylus costaricensis]